MRYLDKNNLVVLMDGDTPRYLSDRWGNVAYPYKDTYDTLNALKRDNPNAITALESGVWIPVETREPAKYMNIDVEMINGAMFQLKYSKWLKKGVHIKESGHSATLRDSNGVYVSGIFNDRWSQCQSL